MAYYGGGGVQGILHPSLQAYFDCFESPPFPRMFPRGGGVWDQSPILMQHFRVIREVAVKWKDAQHPEANIQDAASDDAPEGDLEAALEAYLDQIGENGTF